MPNEYIRWAKIQKFMGKKKNKKSVEDESSQVENDLQA